MKKKKLRFTRQFDQMDCGPACVRMVASAHGRDYPLSYLRTLSHLTREGVSVAGIRDALGAIGMASASFELTLDQLCDKCPLPTILHWEQNHFVVLYGISRSFLGKRRVFSVANPAFGRQRLGEEEFRRHWLSGDRGVVIACEPTEGFHDRKEVRERHSMVRFARKYVWSYRWDMAQTALGMLFGMALSLLAPFLTQAMVDDGIGLRDMGIITSVMLAQVFLFLGSFLMGTIGSWVSLYMGTRISINVLSAYLEKMLRLPMGFFDTKSVGDYQQRLGDNGRLQGFVTYNTLQTAFSLLTVPALLAVIGFYSLRILLAYMAFTVVCTLWMAYFFKRRKALDYERFRLSATNQNKMYELMSGITDIKVNAFENYKLMEWKDMQERMFGMAQKSLRLSQVQNAGYALVGQLRNILLTFWIASEVVDGNLTLGMMVSMSGIIGQVNGPLSQLIGFLQQYQDARISLERSEEVHLCEPEDSDGMESLCKDHPVDIELRDVSFGYSGSIGERAIEDVRVTLPAGKTTAIVGESGSGKTTLLKLLLKFYTPSDGDITLGGKSLAGISARSVREASGVVMQDNFVFSGTVRDNIVLGLPLDENRLGKALDAACLRQFVDAHPLGLDTKIGSDGIGISGGERQRIMIARAIYKQPSYIMLDEATSSLDAETERRITGNLAEFCRHRTMVVIAHRLSTVRNADNIIVLRHGKVVEEGTHGQLVAMRGYYYQLIKNQLELESS